MRGRWHIGDLGGVVGTHRSIRRSVPARAHPISLSVGASLCVGSSLPLCGVCLLCGCRWFILINHFCKKKMLVLRRFV